MIITGAACSKNRTRRTSLVDPQRNGSQLTNYGVRYLDHKPGLSADGTRVIFVSGRDSGTDKATQKVLKVEWPAGGTPGTPGRLTTEEIGVEKEAVIAPDGSRVAIIAYADGRPDVYLADFAGAAAPVRLTDDDRIESDLRFAADSKALVWTSQAGDGTRVTAIDTGDGTSAGIGKPSELELKDKRVSTVFWMPATGGYKLAIGVRTEAATADVTVRTMATLSDLAAAEAVTYKPGMAIGSGISVIAAGSTVLAVERLTAEGGKSKERLGTAPADEGSVLPTIPVVSEAVIYSPEGTGGDGVRLATPAGHQIQEIGLGGDGATVFMLAQQYFRCDGEAADNYGTVLAVAGSDGTALRQMTPRLKIGDGTYEPATGPCDQVLSDGSKAFMDRLISGFAVNGGATKDAFRIAYVTRFTGKFDNACGPKTGDPEIRVWDQAGDQGSISELSSNGAPIGDDDRGTADPCTPP